MKTRLFAPLLLLSICAFPGRAIAHALATDFALRAANQLEIKAEFSSGEPFPDAKVLVYAPGDRSKPWLEGTTDAEGNFIFEPDTTISGDWRIEIGEDSHMDILSVPASDRGIAVEEISAVPSSNPHRPHDVWVALGAMATSATLGFAALSSREKRQVE